MVETSLGASHAVVSGAPEAPPLLLFPGAGLSATSWYRNIGELAARFRVLAFDLVFDRGLGQQRRTVRDEVDVARWVGELLDRCDLEEAALAGLSQGAWVAAAGALWSKGRVTRLALLAPAGVLRPLRPPFWLLFRGLQRWLPKGDPYARARRTFEMMGPVPDEIFLQQTALGQLEYFREQRPPVLPRRFKDAELGRISCPTLVLVAENELLYNSRRALQRAKLIPELVDGVSVAGSGHFLTIARPEVVDAALLGFLSE